MLDNDGFDGFISVIYKSRVKLKLRTNMETNEGEEIYEI